MDVPEQLTVKALIELLMALPNETQDKPVAIYDKTTGYSGKITPFDDGDGYFDIEFESVEC